MLPAFDKVDNGHGDDLRQRRPPAARVENMLVQPLRTVWCKIRMFACPCRHANAQAERTCPSTP
jgi:hypothetical protein